MWEKSYSILVQSTVFTLCLLSDCAKHLKILWSEIPSTQYHAKHFVSLTQLCIGLVQGVERKVDLYEHECAFCMFKENGVTEDLSSAKFNLEPRWVASLQPLIGNHWSDILYKALSCKWESKTAAGSNMYGIKCLETQNLPEFSKFYCSIPWICQSWICKHGWYVCWACYRIMNPFLFVCCPLDSSLLDHRNFLKLW